MSDASLAAAGNDRPPVRRRWPLVPLLLVLALLLVAVFGDRGLLRAVQYRRQKAALEAEMRQLEATNAALRKEIAALRSDRRTIEGIARKELGMVREDELIYQFPSRPQAGRSPARSAEPVEVPAVEAAVPQ